jgi:hypothetical protein
MKDLLDQLAEMEAPPPPPEFDRQLHERLNRTLAAQHLIDFAVGAVPWALLHFARAVLGAISFSIGGRSEDKGERRS